jgi:hypothetical protein
MMNAASTTQTGADAGASGDGTSDSLRLASYTLNMSAAAPPPVDPQAHAETQARVQAAFRLGWGIEELIVRVRQVPSSADDREPFPEFPSDLAHFRDAATVFALLRADLRREEQALLSPMPDRDGSPEPLPSIDPNVNVTARVDAIVNGQTGIRTAEAVTSIVTAARDWDRRAVEVMLDPTWAHKDETTKLLSAYEVGKALCLTVRSIWEKEHDWEALLPANASAVTPTGAVGSSQPSDAAPQATTTPHGPTAATVETAQAALDETWKEMFTGRRVEQIQRHLEALAPLLQPDVAAVVSKSLAHWRAALINLGDIVNSQQSAQPSKQPSEWPRPHGLSEVTTSELPDTDDGESRRALYVALVEQADNWYDLLSGRRTMASFSISGSITNLLIDELPNLGAFLGAGVGHLEATVAQAGDDLRTTISLQVASLEGALGREMQTARMTLRRVGFVTLGVMVATFVTIVLLDRAGVPAIQGLLAAMGAGFAGITSVVGTAVAGVIAFVGLQNRTSIVAQVRQEATNLEDRLRATVHGVAAQIVPQPQQTRAQANQDLATVRANVQSATDAVAATIARTKAQTKLDPDLQALRDDVIAIRKTLTAHVDAITQAQSQGAEALHALTAEAQKLPLAVEVLEGKLRHVEQQVAVAGGQVEAYAQLQPTLATIEGNLKSLVSKGEGFLGQLEHGALLDIEGIVSDSVTYLLATIRLEERIIAVSEPLVRFVMRHYKKGRLNHPGETMENFLEVVYPGVKTNLIELRAALRTVIRRSTAVRAPSSGQGRPGAGPLVAPGVAPLPRA